MLVVLDGSSAMEAMILGVPLLVMCGFVYDFLDLAIENKKISNLNEDMIKAINLNKSISKFSNEMVIPSALPTA